MLLLYKDRVKEVASNKPNASTAFNLPDSAPTGFQSFDAAYATNAAMECMATNGTDWESFIGTFTAGSPDTLARTTLLASSTGSSIDWSSGGDVTVFVTPSSKSLNQFSNLLEGITPGGRLTLESGVPVSTTDQTSKSTLYYTPYVSNIISLWDGSAWSPIEFTETSITLSGLTANLPYDVYAYRNGGTLALEFLAWTSITARATAVTIQDGRYCKSGDKTRLLLGTFYAVTTTTTEDSQINRYLCNVYNTVNKPFFYDTNDAGHSYSSSTFREYSGTTNRINAVSTGTGNSLNVTPSAILTLSAATNGRLGISENVTTSSVAGVLLDAPFFTGASGNLRASPGVYFTIPRAGHSFFALVEASSVNGQSASFSFARIRGNFEC